MGKSVIAARTYERARYLRHALGIDATLISLNNQNSGRGLQADLLIIEGTTAPDRIADLLPITAPNGLAFIITEIEP